MYPKNVIECNRLFVFVLITCILCFLTSNAKASWILSGQIGHYDGTPPYPALSGVSIKAYNSSGTVIASGSTSYTGEYSLGLPDNTSCEVHYKKDGYQKVIETISPRSSNLTKSFLMMDEVADPPAAAHYPLIGSTMEIHFKWTDNKYYMGKQSKAGIYVYHDNANFVVSHACTDSTQANSGTQANKEAHRVDHLHFLYDYGSGPGTLDWAASGIGWPNTSQGNAYWDWVYSSYKDSGGTNPTTAANCVSYGFHGKKSGLMSVTCWVNSKDYPNCTNIGKLWTALTIVYAGSDGSSVTIQNGDIAGTQGHVWKLYRTISGSGPATQIKWKCAESGLYTYTHPSTQSNCGVMAGVSGENRVTGSAGSLSRYDNASPLNDYKPMYIVR